MILEVKVADKGSVSKVACAGLGRVYHDVLILAVQGDALGVLRAISAVLLLSSRIDRLRVV